jgi:hypothetical protein
MEVDPACRAEINNCTPLCGISDLEQGKITVKQPWELRKAELISPIPISYSIDCKSKLKGIVRLGERGVSRVVPFVF